MRAFESVNCVLEVINVWAQKWNRFFASEKPEKFQAVHQCFGSGFLKKAFKFKNQTDVFWKLISAHAMINEGQVSTHFGLNSEYH